MAIISLRWHLFSLIQRSRAGIDRESLFDFFGTAYEEPGRCFHTLLHIHRCLEEFEEVRHLANNQIAVEWALWFHDEVWEPGQLDNEERSAVAAYTFCITTPGLEPIAEVVRDLVLATDYKKPRDNHTPDQILVTDIDLSSLGQSQAVFEEDSGRLRKEFAFLSDAEFRAREIGFMKKLLGLTTLYRTPHFINKYEDAAQDNIRRYLQQLIASS